MYLLEEDAGVFMNKDLEAEVILFALVQRQEDSPSLVSGERENQVIENPVGCDY